MDTLAAREQEVPLDVTTVTHQDSRIVLPLGNENVGTASILSGSDARSTGGASGGATVASTTTSKPGWAITRAAHRASNAPVLPEIVPVTHTPLCLGRQEPNFPPKVVTAWSRAAVVVAGAPGEATGSVTVGKGLPTQNGVTWNGPGHSTAVSSLPIFIVAPGART